MNNVTKWIQTKETINTAEILLEQLKEVIRLTVLIIN